MCYFWLAKFGVIIFFLLKILQWLCTSIKIIEVIFKKIIQAQMLQEDIWDLIPFIPTVGTLPWWQCFHHPRIQQYYWLSCILVGYIGFCFSLNECYLTLNETRSFSPTSPYYADFTIAPYSFPPQIQSYYWFKYFHWLGIHKFRGSEVYS